MTTASIITYCTNDYRFIGKCIEEARHFSQTIIIPVCDHFFDGTPENRMLLDATYAQHPDCQFIEFAYSNQRLYNPFLRFSSADEEWVHFWHTTARYIGFLHLPPEIEFVLFLDCDEIPEGRRFAKWLKTGEHEKWNAMRLLAYYYVLRPDFRADRLQSITLLVRKSAVSSHFFFHPDERYALYRYLPEPKNGEMRAHDGKPLIHHYSWVRTNEECLRKAAAWGHRSDQNWPLLIQKAFTEKGGKNLFGTDLVFEPISEPYFDPLSVKIPDCAVSSQTFNHVKKVQMRDILQMELDVL